VAVRHNQRMNRTAARCLLLCALLLPALAPAQQTAERSAAYQVETGDAWVDTWLQDINHYAERYPDSFLDELTRYSGVPRGYAAALINTHGWQAADVYFACFWAKAIEVSCRDTVRAFSANAEGGWEAVVERLAVPPKNLHWRALRHAIVASYTHWDRPITWTPRCGGSSRSGTEGRRGRRGWGTRGHAAVRIAPAAGNGDNSCPSCSPFP